eukprot:4114200-Pyramimonas_sp.AAC.1
MSGAHLSRSTHTHKDRKENVPGAPANRACRERTYPEREPIVHVERGPQRWAAGSGCREWSERRVDSTPGRVDSTPGR